MAQRLDGWKKAISNGHEIGNHSLVHPCTGNFAFSKDKALEDYTLQKMNIELDDKSFDEIKKIIESAKNQGLWLILAGHEMNGGGIKHLCYLPLKLYVNMQGIPQMVFG